MRDRLINYECDSITNDTSHVLMNVLALIMVAMLEFQGVGSECALFPVFFMLLLVAFICNMFLMQVVRCAPIPCSLSFC